LVRAPVSLISLSRILEKVAVPGCVNVPGADLLPGNALRGLPFQIARLSSRWISLDLEGIWRRSSVNSDEAWMILSSTSGATWRASVNLVGLGKQVFGSPARAFRASLNG